MCRQDDASKEGLSDSGLGEKQKPPSILYKQVFVVLTNLLE